MGSSYADIDTALSQWIVAQPVFFVATAPLSAAGHVNCSPKGGDCLRVLGPRSVAYLDGAGSGIETVSHLRENGRLVLMFCAFNGAPRIVRLHGTGRVMAPGSPDFAAWLDRFPSYPVVRAIIHLDVQRVADSCGYGVPLMDFRAARGDAQAYVRKSSDSALRTYLEKNNQHSIDGLPGMTAAELQGVAIHRD